MIDLQIKLTRIHNGNLKFAKAIVDISSRSLLLTIESYQFLTTHKQSLFCACHVSPT